jgi:nucleotide-binding universal stress UspA family protein
MSTTLLVATDFSPPSDHALREAIVLARALGAAIEVMYVHEVKVTPLPPTADVATRVPAPAEVARTEVELINRARIVEEAQVPCSTYTSFGRAADEVVRRAAEIAPRILIVGTRGHNWLRHAVMGSVAQRIVDRAPCAVLVVPPERRSEG